MNIVTNNQVRDILYWFQLTDREQSEFDYLDTETMRESASFFRYKNNVYDLGEFMRAEKIPEFEGWDGYSSDSFFSGILVKYPKDEWGYIDDGVIVGHYYS